MSNDIKAELLKEFGVVSRRVKALGAIIQNEGTVTPEEVAEWKGKAEIVIESFNRTLQRTWRLIDNAEAPEKEAE